MSSTFRLLTTLSNPTPGINDQFGQDVSIVDDRVLVTALFDDEGATDSGAVHFFDVHDEEGLETIANPTPAVFDLFGQTAGISEDHIVVGAYLDDTMGTDSGAVYLFQPDGTLEYTFFSPTPAANGNFGVRVAVDGDRAVVGTIENVGGSGNGSAYILNLETPDDPPLLLSNPSSAANDRFGSLVAISGDNVLVSALFDDQESGVANGGAAYLFDADNGDLLQTFIKPGTVNAEDRFGERIALVDNHVLIASVFDDTAGTNAGAVYLFDTDGTLQQTFLNPNPASPGGIVDSFGQWMTISGDSVFIGAPGEDLEASNSGVVYEFSATTGALIDTIGNPTPDPDDQFGHRAVASGDKLVISAIVDDEGATDSGVAYVFASFTQVGDSTDETLTGTSDSDSINGLGGNDTLMGKQNDDLLFGAAGDDTLNGGLGDDTLNGGSGDDDLSGNQKTDLLIGGSGDDSLAGGTGADTLRGGADNDMLDGNQNVDLLKGGQGNDTLNGGSGNDTLLGGSGADQLLGKQGADILDGGSGDDTLTGGTGGDVFAIALGNGTDTITDFNVGVDRIGLSAGLTFADLTFSNSAIASGTETLATLTGVDTTTLTVADFTTL